MNKNVKEIYDNVLAKVLDEFRLTEERMFNNNEPDCVGARVSLVKTLSEEGLSNKKKRRI